MTPTQLRDEIKARLEATANELMATSSLPLVVLAVSQDPERPGMSIHSAAEASDVDLVRLLRSAVEHVEARATETFTLDQGNVTMNLPVRKEGDT